MKKKNLIKFIILLFAVCLISVALSACSDNTQANEKTLTVIYMAETGGTVSGEILQTVKYGESGTSVSAVPAVGYEFVKWSDGSMDIKRSETKVENNIVLTAQFQKKQFTVEYIAEVGGTVQGEILQTVKYGENGTEVTAIPEVGYEFVKWSDGSTDIKRTETKVEENIVLTAQFQKKQFTVEYTAETGGTVSGEISQMVKYGESGTKVTAVPEVGYEFVKWSDGRADITRTETKVEKNIVLTAQFQKKQFTVEYIAEVGGTVQGEISQTVKYGENGTEVTAVPEVGYEFVK